MDVHTWALLGRAGLDAVTDRSALIMWVKLVSIMCLTNRDYRIKRCRQLPPEVLEWIRDKLGDATVTDHVKQISILVCNHPATLSIEDLHIMVSALCPLTLELSITEPYWALTS